MLVNFKTGQTIKNDIKFDWNHGDVGRYIGVHTGGYVTRWNGTRMRWEPKQMLVQYGPTWTDNAPDYCVPVYAGGYLQHWPDDQLWAYPTRYVERPYLSEIQCIFAKPLDHPGRVCRFRICFSNLMRKTDRKGNKTIVLDRPNISRDGTKLLFNSNVFGQCEVYMVVLKKPLPPTDLVARWLGDRVRHRPNEMSGGQQQRVAIARALVNEPSIILADEPTGNLDSQSSLEILDLLHKLHAGGATIVMVTHEPDIARLAYRRLHMRDGRIESIEEG